MEKIEELLNKIAHDVKKPFSNLTMLSKIIPKKLDDPEFIESSLKKVNEDAEQIINFIEKVKTHLRENGELPEDLSSL